MSTDENGSTPSHRPTTVIVGFVVIIALTLVIAAGVSVVFFELEPDEGPPEIHWTLEQSDPLVLTHDGGDAIECDRILITGDFGSGETLCEYFESEVITEGDSAELMSTDGQSGLFSLTWQDVNLDQNITIFEEPVN